MADQNIKLAVGGTVQASYGTYLPRPADDQLFEVCQAGRFAYVLACRQIGKSSLMMATSQKLAQSGVIAALIDLNRIGRSAEAKEWYFSFITELAHQLALETDVQAWWDGRPPLSTFTQRFLQFLQEVVLQKISQPIVVFIDEIDMTLGLDFTDDFFAAIRSVYNDRAQYPVYHRLTFVLLGVASPDELIKDPNRTPFNIGQAINLRDFTQEECWPFREAIEYKYPGQGQACFDQIYSWTGGHPYLTQKLCQAVMDGQEAEASPELVDTLINTLFLAAESRSEDNIQFVQNRVTNDPYAQDILKTYQRVLRGDIYVEDNDQSPAVNRLKLYGLTVAEEGCLKVRNRLYSRVFDMTWIQEMLRLASTRLRLDILGRYEILRKIGQGGFATVYLARAQDAASDQQLALKVLKSADVEDENQIRRFKQESQAASTLNHPNIIHIYDTGGDEDVSFIAMEYIPGGTVRDRLKNGPMSRSEAMHIIRQIGAALTEAHQRDIIHRDVNPNNILLDITEDAKQPRAVLTDFGLIKLLSPSSNYPKIHSSSIVGTVGYIAPEQWRQEPVTPATDLYALALTFFEMLAGQLPFKAKASPYDVMTKHHNEIVFLLSELVPEVGTFFDDILLQAMATEPASRFESVNQFIQMLEQANTQAAEYEKKARQQQAANTIEIARSYTRKGDYDHKRALSLIEVALEMYPDYSEALQLRGKVRLQEGHVSEALADYRQAYEQHEDPHSEIGLEYLEALNRIAEDHWQHHDYYEAADYYNTIWQILDDRSDRTGFTQTLWSHACDRLIAYHHHEADIAYAGGRPADIDQAIEILNQKLVILTTLQAGEVQKTQVQEKRRLLQMNKYQQTIAVTQAAIHEASTRDNQLRYASDEIFQNYETLDRAYQTLTGLDPQNEQWAQTRISKWKEWAESHYLFAERALGRLDPDYEAALRHFKAIHNIEQTRDSEIAQKLNLNLAEKIAGLEEKVDHDGKYREVKNLMAEGDLLAALARLDRDFIREGNYEHRDVARLLWGLVYARQHDGNLPPEWESLSGFEVLTRRLVTLERSHIHHLKQRLKAWSKAEISETLRRYNAELETHIEEVGAIEAMLKEAVTHGVVAAPDIERCHTELGQLRGHIRQLEQSITQIEVESIVRQVEAWLQKIEDIEALLQTGNPVKDVLRFFNQSDEKQQAIEQDPNYAALQTLETDTLQIGQTIDKMKFRIQKRLIRVLIDDVGRRDDEISAVQHKLTQLQREADQERQTLNQQVKLFSISIIPAILTGIIIGILATMAIPGVQNLTLMIGLAVLTLLIWFGWSYYSRPAQGA